MIIDHARRSGAPEPNSVSNRDQFVRRTGALNKQDATRPLGGLGDPSASLAKLASAIEKANEVTRLVEAPMEWLHQAAIRAKLPLPGVPDLAPRHALTPQAEELIAYLFGTFRTDPMLAQVVQVAVFRFYDARKALRAAQSALDDGRPSEEGAEALRLRVYYLVNFHADFARDPLLAKLFPGPKTLAASAPEAPLTNVQRLKIKLVRESALNKAEVMVHELKLKIQAMRQVLDLIDHPSGTLIRDLMNAELRRVRILSMGLKSDEAAIATLRAAITQYAALAEGLAKARRGGETEALEALARPLASLASTCRAHPLLATLFPT
jgi:hypothetical protein